MHVMFMSLIDAHDEVTIGVLFDLVLEVLVVILVQFKVFRNTGVVEWSRGVKNGSFKIASGTGVML